MVLVVKTTRNVNCQHPFRRDFLKGIFVNIFFLSQNLTWTVNPGFYDEFRALDPTLKGVQGNFNRQTKHVHVPVPVPVPVHVPVPLPVPEATFIVLAIFGFFESPIPLNQFFHPNKLWPAGNQCGLQNKHP